MPGVAFIVCWKVPVIGRFVSAPTATMLNTSSETFTGAELKDEDLDPDFDYALWATVSVSLLMFQVTLIIILSLNIFCKLGFKKTKVPETPPNSSEETVYQNYILDGDKLVIASDDLIKKQAEKIKHAQKQGGQDKRSSSGTVPTPMETDTSVSAQIDPYLDPTDLHLYPIKNTVQAKKHRKREKERKREEVEEIEEDEDEAESPDTSMKLVGELHSPEGQDLPNQSPQ